MELKCPNCGALIRAENVNIQKTLAVCGQCDNIFDFGHVDFARKKKQRPTAPPKRLNIQESESHLEMSMRFALGPGPMFGLVMSSIGSTVLWIALLTALAEDGPQSFMLVAGLMLLGLGYLIAVFLTTTTRLTADDDALTVESGPLPFPLKDDKTISRHEVVRVFYKEGLEPLPPGMPAHNVYAELRDGSQIPLVTSLPRDYAFYIARALDVHLQPDEEIAALGLEPGGEFHDRAIEDDAGIAQIAQQSTDEPPSRATL